MFCIHVYGVQIRKGNPQDGGEYGAGNFIAYPPVPFWYKVIHKGKINDKQKQGQTGTRQKEQCFNMGNAREKVNDKLDNLVSIDEKRQADNNHNTK